MNALLVSAADARQITDRIKTLLENAQAAATTLRAAIADAHDRNVHVALGYESWTAYVSEEFRGLGSSLDRGNRQVLVMELADLGMSTRAIAPVVGVSRGQVTRDKYEAQQVSRDVTPSEAPTEPKAETPAPRTVTGLDGKRYGVQPRQSEPRRKALSPEVISACAEMSRIARRVSTLMSDDRFDASALAASVGSDVLRAFLAVADCVELVGRDAAAESPDALRWWQQSIGDTNETLARLASTLEVK